jgi:putrescine importer
MPLCKTPKTAFMDVALMASGPILPATYGIMLLVSSMACGLAGHVSAARLLYGIGRDDVLPREIFAYLGPKKNPTYNAWIVGVLYAAYKTRGFTLRPKLFDFSES